MQLDQLYASEKGIENPNPRIRTVLESTFIRFEPELGLDAVSEKLGQNHEEPW